MRTFTIRLLLFCLAPLPLLVLLGRFVDAGLRKSHHYYYAEWSDIFSGKMHPDLIISGSSRAWVQISPRILDSMLHINTYNFGMDGAAFNIQYERLKIYLKYNPKPRYVLQEVGYTATLVKLNDLPNPWQFLPYLSEPSVLKITQHSNMPYSLAERYFPMYKYNNEFPLIKEGILSNFGKGVVGTKYKGYEGQDKVWDSSFNFFKTAYPHGKAWPIDTEAVAAFREFLDYCRTAGIQVIMVYPPSFIQSLDLIANKDEIMSVYSKLSAEYHVPLLNYMYDSMNYSRDNFYNSLHLNKRGAELFSARLAADLKQYVR